MTKPCDFAHAIGYGRPASQPADAGLLALGVELERLWTAERAAPADTREAAFDATSAVVDQIEALPATTLAGLKVKARAFSWCRSGDPVTAEDWFGPSVTTDVRLLVGLARDLLQLADTNR